MILEKLLEEQNKLSAEEIIKAAFEVFSPDIIATSSFGVSSGVLIDLIYKAGLPIKIVYINTGFLFKETIEYIDVIKKKYSEMEFIELLPAIDRTNFLTQYGKDIMKHNSDICCQVNKVEPLNKFLIENKIKGWLTGLRREQTEFRKTLQRISLTNAGIYKINPILDWTSKEVYYYMKNNEIPFHPLYSKGYTSIGCEPCTDLPTNDERSGRWKNSSKKECGIHTKI